MQLVYFLSFLALGNAVLAKSCSQSALFLIPFSRPVSVSPSDLNMRTMEQVSMSGLVRVVLSFSVSLSLPALYTIPPELLGKAAGLEAIKFYASAACSASDP
ncbi:Cyclochlorotine synthetase [Clarias magur]|uniref:Cyclochlorotine synthetase n=1 Tax=Clarias magur TaxID=1594786 RepID=A0A8J4TGP4_CLAMG|nr:Cyclochlorotine synthetase [Clarias magur]